MHAHTFVTILRGNKTHFNKNFRNAVRSNSRIPATNSSKERMFSDVSWVDCLEALAALQLSTNCVVRMCVNKQQLAEHVIVMTKALSEALFRYIILYYKHGILKARHLGFYNLILHCIFSFEGKKIHSRFT